MICPICKELTIYRVRLPCHDAHQRRIADLCGCMSCTAILRTRTDKEEKNARADRV